MLETFGLRLRKVREEKGLSAKVLAEKSGVGINTIYNSELYNRFPRFDNVALLADALGVSLDWLAGRDGNA